MRLKYAVLLFTLFYVSVAAAEPQEVEYDMFGVPTQEIRVIESPAVAAPQNPVEFPPCDDAALLAGVRRLLAEDESKIADESIVARRKRLLALKNADNFAPLAIRSFRPQDNYALANIMITAKINDGLTDDDFAICIGDNPILKRRIYLLLRNINKDGGIRVDVVNYRLNMSPFFIYEKNLANI